MEGIKGYSKPSKDGGVTVDVVGMAVDLITVMKAGGYGKPLFLEMVEKLWDDVKVEVTIPTRSKN